MEIQILSHKKFGEVRVLLLNGKFYFVGRDVAAALGFKDTKKAISHHVTAQDKFTAANLTEQAQFQGGDLPPHFTGATVPHNAIFINESGLYSLVMRSNLPLAKEFQHWVTSEVLPSIRKNGYYIKQDEITPSPRLAAPKIKKPKFKEKLTYEQLLKLIEYCTNDKLRDELIRRAIDKEEPLRLVYVLEMSNGLIKIGITQDFQRRAREILNSTGLTVKNWCHTDKISSEMAREIEAACHEHFNFCRVNGEFFDIDFNSAVKKLSSLEEVTDFYEII